MNGLVGYASFAEFQLGRQSYRCGVVLLFLKLRAGFSPDCLVFLSSKPKMSLCQFNSLKGFTPCHLISVVSDCLGFDPMRPVLSTNSIETIFQRERDW